MTATERSLEPKVDGPASTMQSRDQRGRFKREKASRIAPASAPVPGRASTRHPRRKTKLELVRALTLLDQRLERRRAEAAGIRLEPAVGPAPANMRGIRTRERQAQQRRRTMLAEALVDLAETRTDPRPSVLAREMSSRLGIRFGVEQLYAPSLIDIWKPDADYFGKQDVDALPRAKARWRMSRKLLVHHLKRTKRLLEEAEAQLRDEFVRASRVEGGWTRLQLGGRDVGVE